MNSPKWPDRPEFPIMDRDTAIINPARAEHIPDLGPFAVMVSSGGDFKRLCGHLNLADRPVRLMMSKVFPSAGKAERFSVAGPVVGAPYATLVLESLIAWGVREVVYVGWCGAIDPSLETGDILVAAGAVVDEGTSPHYGTATGETADADPQLTARLTEAFRERELPFRSGTVWTTDAVYRETREKVEHFRNIGTQAVEMELSALFTVARFRGIRAGAVLVVSDDLSDFTWRPGFTSHRFKQHRSAVIEVIQSLCQTKP